MTPVSCTEIATAFSKTPVEKPWQRKKLRAPQQDETLLVEPPVAEADHLLSQNRTIFKESSVSIAAEPLHQLRQQCCEEILAAAVEYTMKLEGEDHPPLTKFPASQPLIVTGHQPELYHPGVWVKNHLTGILAKQSGGIPLNLIIDNDNLGSTTLRVPVGSRDATSLDWIPFDSDHHNEPWEEARLNSPDVFAAFAAKIESLMKEWKISPVVNRMWKPCVSKCSSLPLLRDVLTAGRHRLERDWGLDLLELPLSHLCETKTFRKFAAHILFSAKQFRRIHNQVLDEYRQVNRIRSQTHPVPELKNENGQIETPFWIWKEGENDRQPLFVSSTDDLIVISDRTHDFISIPCDENHAIQNIVDALEKLSHQGYRIRTRALTTTMFSRLFLADLFVHGIGGAKYDEMTDRLIVRFFGMTAPQFVTATATLHLPLDELHGTDLRDIRETKRELRRLHYHPDLFLEHKTEEIAKLIQEKQKLIAEQNDPTLRTTENRIRFLRLKEIRQELARLSETAQTRLEQRLETQLGKLEIDRFLTNREYSFLLYPEEKLKRFMQNLAGNSA